MDAQLECWNFKCIGAEFIRLLFGGEMIDKRFPDLWRGGAASQQGKGEILPQLCQFKGFLSFASKGEIYFSYLLLRSCITGLGEIFEWYMSVICGWCCVILGEQAFASN